MFYKMQKTLGTPDEQIYFMPVSSEINAVRIIEPIDVITFTSRLTWPKSIASAHLNSANETQVAKI